MPHRSNPYTDPSGTTRARRLRRDMPVPERRLWSRLRARRCGGLKFRRQVPVGRYLVDFLCEEARLVVELDGMSHSGCAEADAQRTEHLQARGLCVLRVTNDDVLRDPAAVAEHILHTARSLGAGQTKVAEGFTPTRPPRQSDVLR